MVTSSRIYLVALLTHGVFAAPTAVYRTASSQISAQPYSLAAALVPPVWRNILG